MSTLKVFNSLTQAKEEFVPLIPGRVLMYACGPTVYDLSHLGHARMSITFDVVQRFLRFSGYEVTFVRNITDIDDKIINKAKAVNKLPEQVAREYIFTFWKDMRALNAQMPDLEPRATEYIGEMIAFIEGLIERNHAYVSGEDVYFDVMSFPAYGQLKKQSLEELLHGAREQVRSQDALKEGKKNSVDFALWKAVPAYEHGWRSPWGWGRPGWHLECSTMIKHCLGQTIDIHGGGEDLLFPHHENEIAQSEALHGKPLAKYWLHNSFVQVNAEKMSKSLGNFTTIADVLRDYSADAIRLFVLQTHYRSPIEFSVDSMNAAAAGMSRLLRAMRYAPGDAVYEATASSAEDESVRGLHNDFVVSMNNDFNTPQAVSALFGLADLIFSSAETDAALAGQRAAALKYYAQILGLGCEDVGQSIDSQTGCKLVDILLNMRETARLNKDYKTSDHIRDQLQQTGIRVMDVKGGKAAWEKL